MLNQGWASFIYLYLGDALAVYVYEVVLSWVLVRLRACIRAIAAAIASVIPYDGWL